MTKYSFRDYHILNILREHDAQKLPLDLVMHHYFRAHKAIGSKDRGFIAEHVYALMRWRGLLDYFCKTSASWQQRLELFRTVDRAKASQDLTIPIHIRASFPKILFQLIQDSYGETEAFRLCLASNEPAPTTVRANLLKTTRDQLLQLWVDKYKVSPGHYAVTAILFHEKLNFFTLPEFRSGLFEVQDEGSQVVSRLVQATPGQIVLDYCAGSGGKSLAIAPLLKGTGQIFLHDIRPHALLEAKKRLKRAGIQNAQVLEPNPSKEKRLKKQCHWVLVDAPCSGTGTIRRNPDMKWNFTQDTLETLIGQQRTIFEKALSFMKPDGRIVYATCSILKEENESQIEHFLKTYGLDVEGTLFKSLPEPGKMDGFFGAVLKRKNSFLM